MSDYDQYCIYCGEELVEGRAPSYTNPRYRWITLECPKRKWWNLNNYKHSQVFTTYEDIILNYDPITGERIKKNVKSK